MYFNKHTGELSETECGFNMFIITRNWFPYHNLDGKYVGCKTHEGFFTVNQKHVRTYEEMNW